MNMIFANQPRSRAAAAQSAARPLTRKVLGATGWLAFLLCASCAPRITQHPVMRFAQTAQEPPAFTPQKLRVIATLATTAPTLINLVTIHGTNNPLGTPHQGWATYWQPPDTNNLWVPEYSVNGWVTWSPCNNMTISGNPLWNWTETGTNWTYPTIPEGQQWQVRIRNLGPIPPLPAPSTIIPDTFILLPPRSDRHQ